LRRRRRRTEYDEVSCLAAAPAYTADINGASLASVNILLRAEPKYLPTKALITSSTLSKKLARPSPIGPLMRISVLLPLLLKAFPEPMA